MRHMSTPRANGRIIRLVVALVIGVAATSISAYWPLYMVERGGGARINDEACNDENRQITQADLNADGVVKLSAGRKRHAVVKVA